MIGTLKMKANTYQGHQEKEEIYRSAWKTDARYHAFRLRLFLPRIRHLENSSFHNHTHYEAEILIPGREGMSFCLITEISY
jgi:hypothetical protein